MMKNARSVWMIAWVGGIALTATTWAQAPTFSLEAIAVNSILLRDGPGSRVAAAPGDVITAEIYLRDWSPEQQQLAAYQAQLEPTSFSSGSLGFIEPVEYEARQESEQNNPENCFLTETHPRFVHSGLKTLALTDSRSKGYRWMSVLLGVDGPVCPQDGTKYYCGTIKLRVSDNARGPFTLTLMEGLENTGLRDGEAAPILPIAIESLTVVVHSNIVTLIEGLNGAEGVPDFQIDLDRDGKQSAADVLQAIQALNISP
ncbi:MAG: hypothetical protein KJ749_07090 [Planctomycetes bacterium]|nr:hypothetical protein [Planctomycetota bacterium]